MKRQIQTKAQAEFARELMAKMVAAGNSYREVTKALNVAKAQTGRTWDEAKVRHFAFKNGITRKTLRANISAAPIAPAKPKTLGLTGLCRSVLTSSLDDSRKVKLVLEILGEE